MWIKRIVTVNWGPLPNREYDLGSLTMLAGSTGSGKSTLEDAIQTVMTAAYRNLFTYNPAQDEVTQGGRGGKQPRTLASYILGADDSKYARPGGAHGHIAVTFAPVPEQGEKAPLFTALVGAAARLEVVGTGESAKRTAREEQIRFIILPEVEVRQEHLITAGSDGRLNVVPVEDTFKHLRQLFGSAIVDFGDNKRNYLGRLWAAVRGRSGSVSFEEAKRAAITFSRSMAYKPVHNIGRFIRDEILAPPEIQDDIQGLSDTIRNFYRLRDEAERMQESIDRLASLDKHAVALRRAYTQFREYRVMLDFKRLFDKQAEVNRTRADKVRTVAALRANLKRASEIKSQLRQIAEKVNHLEAMRAQHDALTRRDELSNAIDASRERHSHAWHHARDALNKTRKSLEAIRQALNASQRVRLDEELAPGFKRLDDLSDLIHSVDLDAAQRLSTDLAKALPESAEGMSALKQLIQTLDGVDVAIELLDEELRSPEGLSKSANQRLYKLQADERSAQVNRDQLKRQIHDLVHEARVPYPREVDSGIKRLKEQVPEARVRVLCDLVEVLDDTWQPAVEAYIGNNRFMLIVDPASEVRANQVLSDHPAKVAQGDLSMKRANGILPENSILNTLRVEDPVARAYLHASYGPVVKVENALELKHTPRGLMRNGRASGGFATFRCFCRDQELVFGVSGRRKRLQSLQETLLDAELSLSDIEDYRSHVQGLVNHLDGLQAVSVEHDLTVMLDAAESIRLKREQLEQLDLGDAQQLEEEYQSIKAEKGQLESEEGDLREAKGTLNSNLTQIDDKLRALEDALEDLEGTTARSRKDLAKLAETEEGYDPRVRGEALAEDARAPHQNVDSLNGKIEQARSVVTRHLNLTRTQLFEYNERVGEMQQVHMQEMLIEGNIDGWEHYRAFIAMHADIKSNLKRLRDHMLVQLLSKLQDIQMNVSAAITTDFSQVINRHLQTSKQQLGDLNKVLRTHKFSAETFNFVRYAVKEKKKYRDLFETLAGLEGVDEGPNLFGDASVLKPEQREVLNEILDLLISEDEVESGRRLEEIADYRTYDDYDIERDMGDHKVLMSTWGTGSGGQFETPAYIIRSAAMSTAYKLGDRSDGHLKVIVLDEAFSRMDGPRSVEVLKLLRDSLGFQVIYAMPTRGAGSFQAHTDAKFVFSKVPSESAPGELRTKTLVKAEYPDRDAVARLFEDYRDEILRQAALKFEEDESRVQAGGVEA